MDSLGGDPLCVQVVVGLRAVDEELVGELVGDDPVELLRHRAIEAAQAGLDVSDRDLHLGRSQCRRHGRVDVAGDDKQIGALLGQNRLEALHHPRRLLGMAARADLEHVVRRRYAKLLEKDLRHQAVVMLAGVDDRVAPRRNTRPQGGDHGGGLDEVGPRSDHVDDAHRAPQYPCLLQ